MARLESKNTYTERLHLPALGYVQINFYSCAALCYELYKSTDEITRQSSIPHLGLIAREYSGSQHTRWEYAALQCAIIDIIDRIHKGNPEIGLGSIKIDGDAIPGSELLKSWALLSNFGHCRNTFADEKAIMNLLRRSNAERRAFIATIPSGDLKDYAKNIVSNYIYAEFHWCVTLIRVRRELKKYSRNKKPIEELVRLLKTYGNSTNVNLEKLTQLRRMFALVRKLAIVAIDSRNSHLPTTFDLSAAILGMDLSEQRTTGQSIESIVNPIMGMLTDLLYADKNVLCLMRDYEVQAAAPAGSVGSVQACLDGIANGLVSPFQPSLRHIHRQLIPVSRERDIHDERRRSERLIRGLGSVRVQVDDNAIQGKRYVDFIAPAEGVASSDVGQWIYVACRNLFNSISFNARERANIHLKERDWWKQRLSDEGVDRKRIARVDREYIERLNVEVDVRDIIEQRCAAVVSSVMQMILRPKYSASIEPTTLDGCSFGLQIIRDGRLVVDQYLDEIDALIQEARDPGRENELQLLRMQRRPKGMWFRLACFDRILVLDTTRPPEKRRVTDIDGLTVTVSGSRVRVDLYEAKVPGSGSTSAAKKELRSNVKPILRDAVLSGNRVTGHVRGGRMRLVLDA
ncbi:hypothetical protein [Halofilum ochraceum]|uniref:hypothetical protein n=1 Tax=Halofilum ochraceum TaxID=1611323 RepID=UPI0011131C7B|nr:hypothetical protein [Halofilum ochraceum]